MEPQLPAGRYEGALLLADISGYTAFLDNVRSAHKDDAFAGGSIPDAYAMMSNLLDGIAGRVDPPFTLVKFEGDAVFAVAPRGAAPERSAMVECIRDCYRDFVGRLEEAGQTWTCTCEACSRRSSLELKFIVHYGEYVVQAVGRHADVLGPDVTDAHRLLKNTAREHVDTSAYALFTQAAVEALALTLDEASPFTEEIKDGQSLAVYALALAT